MSDAAATMLRLERLIPTPPAALFALWTAPAEIARWWAPDGYAAEVDAWDLTPGGAWRIVLRDADGRGTAAAGTFRRVDPPRRLVYSWAWEDVAGAPGRASEVSVDFTAVPGGTRLTLVHAGFESSGARDRHDRGWQDSIARLAALVG